MGNIISLFYDISFELYDRYYPKSRLLRPAYVSSTGMVLVLGSQLWFQTAHRASQKENFIFLFSAGVNLGIQLWVSFISGMTMIRILPRHQFGVVQANLFPKYFFISSLCNFGSLYSFLRVNPVSSWKNHTLVLGSLLSGSMALNLINFVWLNIKTITSNQRMHQIEQNAGEGVTIIGQLKHQNKVESDPEYRDVRKKFRLYHSLSLTANLLSVLSTVSQFYLMANKNFFSLQ